MHSAHIYNLYPNIVTFATDFRMSMKSYWNMQLSCLK